MSLIVFFPAVVLMLVAFMDKLPGTLRLEGDALVFRGVLRNKRLRLPPSHVERGPLYIGVDSRVGGVTQRERRAGSYLRLKGEGSTLLIASPKRTRMGHRWTKDLTGPKRGIHDIRIPREALVQLEYHLAARGAFGPPR